MKLDPEKVKRSFKAYDIRGRVPEDLDEDMAFGIGKAYAKFLRPKKVAVGHDIRLSSLAISEKLIAGLRQSGVEIVFLGLCGTEQVYFATFHEHLDGGIMVTASHNPPNHNGMKMVREEAKPISEDTGLKQIAELLLAQDFLKDQNQGSLEEWDFFPDYISHLLKVIDPTKMKSFRVVCNSGNGVAGETLDQLEEHLPLKLIKVFHEPDGNFPHGVPNPLLPEKRQDTALAVKKEAADLGVAWDGDFDRCFFFDERGEFVDGYYIVGLLASYFLKKHPGSAIVHDPRLVWDTREQIQSNGGKVIQYRSGHAFIKEAMRDQNAVYGGETSAHHYFRSFGFCDSGMVPWLVMVQLMSESGKTLSELIEERKQKFPISGEINTKLSEGQDPKDKIQEIETFYEKQALSIDKTDGLSLEFKDWRFNVRMSNTEPLIRLNVEARGNASLLQEKTEEVLEKIRS